MTLNVGLGTFRPVSEERIEDHEMHSEFYTVSPEAAAALNRAKKEGRRIIAVGTTSVRTLESAGAAAPWCPAATGPRFFIYPGFKFHFVDALVTNFHLPQSTLIMLVSALSSRENILHAYGEAVKEKYRFFSFWRRHVHQRLIKESLCTLFTSNSSGKIPGRCPLGQASYASRYL